MGGGSSKPEPEPVAEPEPEPEPEQPPPRLEVVAEEEPEPQPQDEWRPPEPEIVRVYSADGADQPVGGVAPSSLCGVWHATGTLDDGGPLDEHLVLKQNSEGTLFGHHHTNTPAEEHFSLTWKLTPAPAEGACAGIELVQKYNDPEVMPTFWRGELKPPGIVGDWFTDENGNGLRDAGEVGGNFSATLVEAAPGAPPTYSSATSPTASPSSAGSPLDPSLARLAQRFDRLATAHPGGRSADGSGVIQKKQLSEAIPAIAESAFGPSVLAMLAGGGGNTIITKEQFISVLSRFTASSPLETKLRGMFDLFRQPTSADASEAAADTLGRNEVESMMAALYGGQLHGKAKAAAMAGGLLKEIGTSGPDGSGRVITWEKFAEACRAVEDLDAMLTLIKPAESEQQGTP